MADDQVVRRRLGLVHRAEAKVVVLAFGGRVHPAALRAAERPLLAVARDDVLPELGAERLEDVAQVSDEGKVAQDRVPALYDVVHREPHESRHDDSEDDHRSNPAHPGCSR